MTLVVIALGGNALLQRGQSPDADLQQQNVRAAAAAIAEVARSHDVVVTHGNGPQVGLLALESEQDPALSRPFPLDVVGAETEGMVGYWLEREIHNALPERPIVTVLTQTIVDVDDPAFATPTKFVGQVYDEATAWRLAQQRGWTVRPDGRYWRRVVPSPAPRGFVEISVIHRLVRDGVLTICVGGGGIPVTLTDGVLTGVEAVIDKDLASSLLATELDADALLLLTDVRAVQRNFGAPDAEVLTAATTDELRSMSFPAGSMGPKVVAACDFVDRGGTFAAIGALGDAAAVMAGTAGTTIRPAGQFAAYGTSGTPERALGRDLWP